MASDNSFTIQVHMQQVDMNDNVLIDSRSQMSSFVIQADRIKSLEKDQINMTVQAQKLQT